MNQSHHIGETYQKVFYNTEFNMHVSHLPESTDNSVTTWTLPSATREPTIVGDVSRLHDARPGPVRLYEADH
jgi:hypothetical protein